MEAIRSQRLGHNWPPVAHRTDGSLHFSSCAEPVVASFAAKINQLCLSFACWKDSRGNLCAHLLHRWPYGLPLERFELPLEAQERLGEGSISRVWPLMSSQRRQPKQIEPALAGSHTVDKSGAKASETRQPFKLYVREACRALGFSHVCRENLHLSRVKEAFEAGAIPEASFGWLQRTSPTIVKVPS